MIEESPSELPPMSIRRRLLLGVLGVGIIAGGFVGTQVIYAAIVPSPIDAGRPFDEQVEPFTFAEDGFTASFPSAPDVQSTVQQVGELSIPITVYSAGTATEQFAVTTAELPAAVVEQDLDTFLTGSLEGAASGAGVELTGPSFTTLGGERALTGTMTVHDVTVHVTMALHNRVQLLVSVVTDNAATADAFVGSFVFD